MPSSTSSFERVIPDRRWLRMGAVSVALAGLLVAGWEQLARKRGFYPGLDDPPELWAATRRDLDSAPQDGIVLVGSSRMLFDFDLDEAQRALGVRPIELALPGANELAGLEHIAADARFHGTVLVSYVPHLTFLPPHAATGGLEKRIASYQRGSLTQRVSYRMFQWFDARLAFINPELTLRKLIEQVDLPQRAGAEGNAMFLPYLVSVDADRRGRLFDGVLTDPARRNQIRAAWLFPDPPSKDPVEQQLAERETVRQQVLWREKAAVDKIRARGGRVIYIRFPSSGGVLAKEEADFPRALTWDALLAVTGAPGIHFQDYPQLASFDCPEWSHLSDADAVEFTRRLMPLVKPLLR